MGQRGVYHISREPLRSATLGRSVAMASAVVAAGFVGSRLLGIARTAAIADAFGTDPELSAYWVAFRLPDLIFQVLAGATIGSAFIPTFARYFGRRSPEAAWRLASSMLNLLLVLTALLALLAFALAPLLVPLLAPGLGEDSGRERELQDLAVELTRIMVLSPVLFAVSGLVTGVLNARYRFLLPALAPMLYNLSIIFGALVLSGPLGVHGLAVGVVAGAALHLLIQVPGLWRAGMHYFPVADWRDAGVREVGRLMGPRVLGLAAGQANFFITVFFASFISDASISALNYAWLLMMMPLGIFGMAISTAVFPLLAEQAGSDPQALRRTISQALRVILFLTIPASLGLILLRDPLVAVLLEHGAFASTDTEVVAGALLFYAIGLFAHGAIEILARGLYALGDTRSPAAAAVAAMALNLLLSYLLVGPMEEEGLALAVTAGALLNAGWHYLSLRGRLGSLEEAAVARSLAKTLLASTVMAGVVAAFLMGGGTLGDATPSLATFLLLLAAIGVGGAAFFGAAIALRTEEAGLLLRRPPLAR